MTVVLETDVLIFGGGCAGLWLLDHLRRLRCRAMLLESGCLGGGQTSASQGILHGGLKYALKGIFSAAANAVREMPLIWDSAIAGTSQPDLTSMRLRSRSCYLWRSDSWQSWVGLLGARTMLEVKPVALEPDERPVILSGCPGQVFRIDERVIDACSFTEVMARRNQGLIFQAPAGCTVNFQRQSDGFVTGVELMRGPTEPPVTLSTRFIVLAAGAGNSELRQLLGLTPDAMQRRPLHMTLVRGNLPLLNGHCVDGAKTRVTITADVDSCGRVVWQVGGQLAEDGVKLNPEELISLAKSELSSVLPGWSPAHTEWATYRVDRAEARTSSGSRPDDVQVLQDRNVFTVWPTKLVLAPRLAQQVVEQIGPFEPYDIAEFQRAASNLNWTTPTVALPLWEQKLKWISDN